MSWPSAILFDFDGVIVNSEPLHLRAFQEVLRQSGISLSDQEYYRELIGFDDRGSFRHVFAKRNRPVTPETFQELLTAKAQTMNRFIADGSFRALPGVEVLVVGLAQNYPLAICSGALRHEIESMLDGIGLREYFPVIVAAEDVTIGKPNAQGYLLTARLLSQQLNIPLQPADCLVIEDAPTVIRSVKAAGFRTLAVATSYSAEQLSDAYYVVQTLDPSAVQAVIPELRLATGKAPSKA
jgi:HAD superfamily hydrolase (TIGR01509 family)